MVNEMTKLTKAMRTPGVARAWALAMVCIVATRSVWAAPSVSVPGQKQVTTTRGTAGGQAGADASGNFYYVSTEGNVSEVIKVSGLVNGNASTSVVYSTTSDTIAKMTVAPEGTVYLLLASDRSKIWKVTGETSLTQFNTALWGSALKAFAADGQGNVAANGGGTFNYQVYSSSSVVWSTSSGTSVGSYPMISPGNGLVYDMADGFGSGIGWTVFDDVHQNYSGRYLDFGNAGAVSSAAADVFDDLFYVNGGGNVVYQIPTGCQKQNCTITWGRFSSTTAVAVLQASPYILLAVIDGTNVDTLPIFGLNAGSSPIGTVSPTKLVIPFEVAAGTTIGSIQMLTSGTAGQDFAATPNDSNSSVCTARLYANETVCTVDVTFTPTAVGTRLGGVTIKDAQGNVLSSENFYGTGQGSMAVLMPGALSAVAGGGAGTPGTTTVPGPSVALGSPSQLAQDGAGNVYFVDPANSLVEKLDPSGNVTVVAGGGSTAPSTNPIPATSASLSQPTGLALDGVGNLYIADSGNGVVEVLSLGKLRVLAGGGSTVPSSTAIDPLTAKLTPVGLAVDGSGDLYISDSQGMIEEVSGFDGKLAAIATGLKAPQGLAVSGSTIYFTENGSKLVKKLVSGSVSNVAGGGQTLPSTTPVSASSAMFSSPAGIAVDAAGDLYVADVINNQIDMVHGGQVFSIAGGGATVPSATAQSSLGARLNKPAGVLLNVSGNLYIADAGNHLVERVTAGAFGITFATPTYVQSSDSADDPQPVYLFNLGNAALNVKVPASGTNPALGAQFSLDSSTTCPQVTSSGTAATVVAGANCIYAVNFAPTAVGAVTGSLVLTDDSLGQSAYPYATQSAALSGTGVSPGDFTSVAVTASQSSVGQGQTVDLTATVTDTTNSSVVPTGSVTFSDSVGGTITSLNGGNAVTLDGTGAARLTGVTLSGDGTHTITANFVRVPGLFAPSSSTTQVSVGAATHFTVTVSGSAVAGFPFTATVTALDANNQVATLYPGAVKFTSSDSNAFLPTGSLSSGTGTFSLIMNTPGNQTITAVDWTDGTITGSASVTVGQAPTYVVTTLTDDASGVASNCTDQTQSGATHDPSCSLRDALTQTAQQFAISFAPSLSGAITLGSTLSIPAASVNIQGPGMKVLTVSGNNAVRVFSVPQGATAIINGLTISGGYSAGSGSGGGIVNAGSLTLFEDWITGNTNLKGGGGVFSSGGSLTVVKSYVTGNNAYQGSSSQSLGGGILATGGTLKIINTQISGNSASQGGGVYADTGVTSATLLGVTVTGNSGNYPGGASLYARSNQIGNTVVAGNTGLMQQTCMEVYDGYNPYTNQPEYHQECFSEPGLPDLSYQGTKTDLGGNEINTTYNPVTSGLTQIPAATPATYIPAIGGNPSCLGTSQNALRGGVTTDLRGAARSATYGGTTCVDAGAVQSQYGLTFKSQPGNVQPGVAFSPDVAVQLTENGTNLAIAQKSITISASAGTLSGTATQKTDATGLAAFPALSITPQEGNEKLTATLALNNTIKLTGVSNAFDVGTPISAIAVTNLPTSTTAGVAVGFTVTAYTSPGVVATSYGGTVTLSSAEDSKLALVNNSTTYTFTQADAGSHTFTSSDGAVFKTAGVDTLTATDGAISGISGGITVSAASPLTIGVISGNNQSGQIGKAFAPLKVKVYDAYENGVPNVAVSWTVAASNMSTATLDTTSNTTGPDGTASVVPTANGIVSASAYTVTANAYSVNTPAVFSLTNTVATPTLNVTATGSGGSTVYGTPVTIAARYNPGLQGGDVPSGQISFYDGSSVLGKVTPTNAQASYIVKAPTVGLHTFGASGAADAAFAAVPLTTATFTVTQATAQFGTVSQPVQFLYGQGGTLTLSLLPAVDGAGVPSGSVSYAIVDSNSSQVASGSVTLSQLPSLSQIIIPVSSAMAPGNYTVQLTYGGDTNYVSGTTDNILIKVGAATPMFTYSVTSPITFGTSLSNLLTASASFNSKPVGGTFAYTATPQGGSAVVVNASTVLGPGTYQLTATFTPDNPAQFTTGTVAAKLVVQPAADTLSLTAVGQGNQTSFGTAVVLTASFTPTRVGGQSPSGTVTFYENGNAIATATPASGVATASIGAPSAGAHTYTAAAQADTYFTAPAQATTKINIAQGTVNVTGPPVSPVMFKVGQATSFEVDVTPSLGTSHIAPTGSLAWDILSAGHMVASGTVQVQPNGSGSSAMVPVPATLSNGSYTAEAVYLGDQNYATNKVTVALQTDTPTPKMNLDVANPIPCATPVLSYLILTVTDPQGNILPGKHLFTVKSPTYPETQISGSATLAPGTYTLTDNWTPRGSAAGLWAPTSASAQMIVSACSTNLTLVRSNPLPVSSPVGTTPDGKANFVTYTVVATPKASGVPYVPSGLVLLHDAATPIGSGVLDGTGTAQITVQFTQTGKHYLSADYLGDGNFMTANAQFGENAIVPGYNQSAPPKVNIFYGPTPSDTPVTATFTPYGFPSESLTGFTCSGLPSWASCIFTPSTVVFNGDNAVQTMTIDFHTNGFVCQQSQCYLVNVGSFWIPGAFTGLLILLVRRRMGRWLYGIGASLLLVVFLGLTSCGANPQSALAPQPGTYSVTVNLGSSGQSIPITVTFQKQ